MPKDDQMDPKIDPKFMKNRSNKWCANRYRKIIEKSSKIIAPDLEKSSKTVVLSSIFKVFVFLRIDQSLIENVVQHRHQTTTKPSRNDLEIDIKKNMKKSQNFNRNSTPKGTPKSMKIMALREEREVKRWHGIQHGLKRLKWRLRDPKNRGKSMPQGTEIDPKMEDPSSWNMFPVHM